MLTEHFNIVHLLCFLILDTFFGQISITFNVLFQNSYLGRNKMLQQLLWVHRLFGCKNFD